MVATVVAAGMERKEDEAETTKNVEENVVDKDLTETEQGDNKESAEDNVRCDVNNNDSRKCNAMMWEDEDRSEVNYSDSDYDETKLNESYGDDRKYCNYITDDSIKSNIEAKKDDDQDNDDEINVDDSACENIDDDFDNDECDGSDFTDEDNQAFDFEFDDNGELRHIETGLPFASEGHKAYEEISLVVRQRIPFT